MPIDSVIRDRLMGKTMQALKHSLDFRSANHSVISSNLANIETPGYEPKKATFSQALKNAMGSREDTAADSVDLRKTHQKHFSNGPGADLPYTIEAKTGPGGRPAKLNIDHEMSRMAKNNLLYEASVQLLSKKFQALKDAIQNGGR